MARKKNTTPPTLDERLAESSAIAESALSVFDALRQDLEVAAQVADAVAIEADQEAMRLERIREDAADEARRDRERSEKIRALFE